MKDSTLKQLAQFVKGPVWDGNLISKDERDWLVLSRYVDRFQGWNYLTTQGVYFCIQRGWLKP